MTTAAQRAAQTLDKAATDHADAVRAWSHDEDPATARTPPPELTSKDLVQALVDAGLIPTNVEWGVSLAGEPPVVVTSETEATELAADDKAWTSLEPRTIHTRFSATTEWMPLPSTPDRFDETVSITKGDAVTVQARLADIREMAEDGLGVHAADALFLLALVEDRDVRAAAVRELHFRVPARLGFQGDACRHCLRPYPCLTVVALEGEGR